MRRRGLLQQFLLFCLTGLVMILLYGCLVFDNSEVSVKDTGRLISKLRHLPLHSSLPVDCRKIVEADKIELAKAKEYMRINDPLRLKDEDFLDLTQNCAQFRHHMQYDVYPVTDEEKNFPIAYSILTFRDVDQTERLLRSIYRPQNFYCIHVDKSSKKVTQEALRRISKCFDNVFMVSKTEDIIYNHMTRLKADLNCMADLLPVSQKWKYFINLPHQQFPLKTNLEIVKILKTYNGANDIEGIITPGRMMDGRFKSSFKYINNSFIRTGPKNQTMPYGARIVKGSAYGVFSFDFVQYIIKDKQAHDILDYLKDVKSPDEYYWATLNHNKVLHAPGRYLGHPERKPWLAVYAAWGGRDRCHGKYVRGVCVFGTGDLNELISRKELFANKFYSDYQYLALDCLQEYLFNKTFCHMPFDSFYYKQLPFIIR